MASPRLERLSDLEMARELRAAMVDPAAPAPSVETILHAIIPHRFVDHTHADAVIALTNTPSGRRHAEEAFGSSVALLVPYVMPGFDLARRCRELVDADRRGDDVRVGASGARCLLLRCNARESYERMIELGHARRALPAGARRLGASAAAGTATPSVRPTISLHSGPPCRLLRAGR